MCGPWLPVAIPCGTGRLRCPTAVATHTGDFWKGNKCLSPSPSPAELLLTSCRAQLTESFHPRSISPFISGSGKRSSCRLQDCTPTAQGWLTGRLNARNQEHEVPPSPTPGPPHAHPAAPSPALGQADSAIPGRGIKNRPEKSHIRQRQRRDVPELLLQVSQCSPSHFTSSFSNNPREAAGGAAASPAHRSSPSGSRLAQGVFV